MPRNNKKLISLREELASGAWPGIGFQQVPLWEEAENVRFTPTGPKKMEGWSNLSMTPVGAPSINPIRGIFQTRDSSGNPKVFWGTLDSLRSLVDLAGSTAAISLGLTGILNESTTQRASQWSFEDFGTWVLATDGVNVPYIDKGSGFSALNTDSEFGTAEVFVVRGPYLIAFNTDNNDREYIWCDTDDPETWTPTSANRAGSKIIREASTEIIAAKPLGDSVVAYTERETFIISFVGDPNIFGDRPGPQGFGAFSKNSVVTVGRRHYVWGPQGIYVNDGVNAEFIDSPAVKDFLTENLNLDQASKIHGYHDEVKNSVIWYYPSSGNEPTSGIAFDYRTGNWWQLNVGTKTASCDNVTYGYPITSDGDGYLARENIGTTQGDGTAISASIRSKPLDGDAPDLIKEVIGFRIGYEGSDLLLSVGYKADGANETTIFTGAASVDESYGFIEPGNGRTSGRYVVIRLYSTAANADWSISAIEGYGYVGGER